METRPPNFDFDGEAVVCPECGGTARRYYRGNAAYRKYWHWVECQECGMEISLVGLREEFHPLTPMDDYSIMWKIADALKYAAREHMISWNMKIAICDLIRPEILGTRHSAPDSNG